MDEQVFAAARRLGAERSPRRDRLHALGLVAPWVGLGALWWYVLGGRPGELVLAGWVVGVCLAVTSATTLTWVAHNLSIARRKGPRRGLPPARLDYANDWTGRPVRADWDEARRARVLIVAVTGEDKFYLAEPRGPVVSAADEGSGPSPEPVSPTHAEVAR